MHNGPTRSQVRKIRKTLVAAMVLAWATQTLVGQTAGGAEPAPATRPASTSPVTVVMRGDAKVAGGAVRLGDVCRLACDDEAGATALGELVLSYRDPEAAAMTVGVEQVVRLLNDNGVGPARVRFQGPIRCEVTFDAEPVEPAESAGNPSVASRQDVALLEWAGEPVPTPPAALAVPEVPAPAGDAFAPPAPSTDGGVQWGDNDWSRDGEAAATAAPLAELLRRDLAERLKLPLDAVQLRFRDPTADYLMQGGVALSQIRPTRAADLGPVAWAVSLAGRSVSVSADATAQVTRLAVAQPIGRGQLIRAGDLIEQPATIRRTGDKGLTLAEAVGQEAARTLDVGDVLAPESLAPRNLVRRGQYVSVTLTQSGLELRTLARALDDGGYGQTVKVKNDTTNEILHVVVTGPQTGTLVDVTGR